MEIALDYGQPSLVLDNLMLCHEAAAHGLGIVLGSDIVSGPWIRAGTLLDPFGARVATDATFHLIASTHWRPGRSFQAVLGWLRGTLDDVGRQGPTRVAHSLNALASASNS
jgi:DNA-binding transcriptional LysR family regulator